MIDLRGATTVFSAGLLVQRPQQSPHHLQQRWNRPPSPLHRNLVSRVVAGVPIDNGGLAPLRFAPSGDLFNS